jgi:RNA polymerase sigma factor (sigma-70 family)
VTPGRSTCASSGSTAVWVVTGDADGKDAGSRRIVPMPSGQLELAIASSSRTATTSGSQELLPPPSAPPFADVFLEHRDMCLRVARRLVRDEGLAQDVVQDVFLAWWRTGGGSYRAERGALAAWLTTITHHKAVDLVRTSERHARLEAAAEAELGLAPAVRLVDDVVWWDLGRQAVRVALQALPLKQREVLSLVYLSGLTQAEVADRLGIPLGTVKSRTHAGLLRLKAALSGTWTPDGLDSADGSTHPGASAVVGSVPSVRWRTSTVEEDVRRCAVELVQSAAGVGAAAPDAMRSLTSALVTRHGVDSLHELARVLSGLAVGDPAVVDPSAGRHAGGGPAR